MVSRQIYIQMYIQLAEYINELCHKKDFSQTTFPDRRRCTATLDLLVLRVGWVSRGSLGSKETRGTEA